MEEKDLVKDDWVALSRFDRETGILDLTNRLNFNDVGSAERLIEAGLVDAKGVLSSKAVKKMEALDKRVSMLQKGLSFQERGKKPSAAGAVARGDTWFTGKVAKKDYITNGHMLILGKPVKGMKVAEGTAELRHQVPVEITKALAGGTPRLVEPKAWSLVEFGGMEVVWMADSELKVLVPIQADYYDFVKSRFTGASFFCKGDVEGVEAGVSVLHACMKGKGLSTRRHMVALVMPVQPNTDLLPGVPRLEVPDVKAMQ